MPEQQFDEEAIKKVSAAYEQLKALLPDSLPPYQKDQMTRRIFKQVVNLSASVTAFTMDAIGEQVPETNSIFGSIIATNHPSARMARKMGATMSHEFMEAIVRFITARKSASCDNRTR